MAANLRKTTGSPPGSGKSHLIKRTELKTKPVADLKAMFDQADGETKSKAFVEEKKGVKKTTSNFVTQKKTDLGTDASRPVRTRPKNATTDSPKNVKSEELSVDDKKAFEALKSKLKKTGVDNLGKDDGEPKVAVSKTYSGGKVCTATIATKKNVENKEVTKDAAASILSFSLTKLRTRPDSIKGEGNSSRGNSGDEDHGKLPDSPRSPSTKYLPGVATGWKGKSEDSGRASPVSQKPGKFSESSVGKLRSDASSDDVKIPGFRSVSPVNLRRNSSDDSLSTGSNNLSPRGYVPRTNGEKTANVAKDAVKTDVNKNISKFESNCKGETTSKTNRSDSKDTKVDKTKVKDIKLKSTFAAEVTKTSTTGNRKSDTKSTAKALHVKSDDKGKGTSASGDKPVYKAITKKHTSLEETKRTHNVKDPNHHRPLSRASSSGSNSSLTKAESSEFKSRLERFASTDTTLDGNKQSSDLKKKEFGVSRKISTDKFQDIKRGFESKAVDSKSQSPRNARKPVLEIKSNKKLLERKQSFEGTRVERKESLEKTEKISPRDRGCVKDAIRSLNELDAKAKVSPVIVRRTQSLPSDSLDDDNDSSADYYESIPGELSYYHDGGIRHRDDVSNEGDISSEADLIYEEIPGAHEGAKENTKKEFNTRRATAFKKRRRISTEEPSTGEIQPGTEGDIDSDTDSSSSGNSGIYEPVDHEDLSLTESDSPEKIIPPELPPIPNQFQKKKKKKDEKGTRGIKEKFKQLYKGKTVDIEGGGAQSAGVLSSLGDKLKKNLKKSKSSSSAPSLEIYNNPEENPVCESEGTDTDADVDRDSLRLSLKSETGSMDNPPPPPPRLPPRHSGMPRASSGVELAKSDEYEVPGELHVQKEEEEKRRLSSSSADNVSRLSGVTLRNEGKSGRLSPPLPPRNRVSGNLDLNQVVPIAPGGTDIRKSGWPPVKDSYLHGQKIDTSNPTPTPTSPDVPYIDASPVASPDAPPLPSRPPKRLLTGTDSYVDVGDEAPPLPQRPASRYPPRSNSTSSYVDVGDGASSSSEQEYSLAEEIRKELEKRPMSSAYIKPHDLATVPDPKTSGAPFEDILKFKSEQQEEDGLYIDLFSGGIIRQSELRESRFQTGAYYQPDLKLQSDDQVYGTMGNRYKSKLESESLYQFYNKDKISRASQRKAIYSSFDESDEEGYVEEDEHHESVYEDLSEYNSSGRGSMEIDKKSTEGDNSSNKLSTLEMFGKQGTVLRCLWAEMPEVKTSGVLTSITPHERKLQESMFEIITSEATYLKSLNVLMNVFLMSEEFGQDHSNKSVLTRQERHVVFSNIGTIRNTSERFLSDLETRWQKSVLLSDICDIITEHSSRAFECYIHYCSNQTFQDRAVTSLKKKQEFLEGLKRLESHKDCQGLPMISFLLLPMQRITRLPLLVDAICHRLDPIKDKDRHKSAINAVNALSKVVKKCNEGAKKMQQTEQMYMLAKQLAFPNKEIKEIPLISASRFLVKEGDVTKISAEAGSRLPFGKSKPGKQNAHLFLFNDILLITKKKGAQYIVTDYAQRNTIHVDMVESQAMISKWLPQGVPSGCKYMFLLVMLENHEKKTVEVVFACNALSDRARWVDAVTSVKVTDDQRIYEEWDCPQVQCVKKYVAKEPDELTLEESDVVNVFKKLEDGMYEGERMRDGERGWFPKSHTIEIVNSHVRARNMRMKYRMQSAAEKYS